MERDTPEARHARVRGHDDDPQAPLNT